MDQTRDYTDDAKKSLFIALEDGPFPLCHNTSGKAEIKWITDVIIPEHLSINVVHFCCRQEGVVKEESIL